MTDILCPTCGRPNPDDQTTCDFCGTPLGAEELSRLDDLVSPEEPADELSRLDDLLPQDQEPLPPQEEPPPQEDLSLRDELMAETPKEDSRLDEIFTPEVSPEPEPPLDEFIQPTEPQKPQKPEEESLEDFLDPLPLEPEEPEEESKTPAEDSTPPVPDIFHEEQPPAKDFLQPTEPLDDIDDFEPEEMSPGFGEDSAWLDMLQEPGSTQEVEPSTAAPPAKKKETDWLEKIKRLNKSADLVDDDSSFPDWLSVSEKTPPPTPEQPEQAEQPPPVPPESPVPSEGVPDWLQMDVDDKQLSEFLKKKDLTDEEYVPGMPEAAPPVDSQEEVISQELPKEPKDVKAPQKKFPSWAADGEDPSQGEEQEIPKGLEFLAGIDPSATAGKGVDPFQIEEEVFDDLFSEELPNWLTSASEDGGYIIPEDELTVGELPGWVEAMRPVVESTDTTGLSEDEDYIENYGPLAGIPSVLPAEADVALDPEKAIRKPLDLAATKTHQEYVSILRKLIADESKTREIKKASPIQTQRILRWLIAIILLVSVTATVIFGGAFISEAPIPVKPQNTGYGALYEEISYLYEKQPVLIAFDYQPAATGELHIAAATVIDHLMRQGTYLSFVSTQPTGPALAEYFLATTQEKHHYRHNLHYVNLGYLPGESAGLLSFLIAPQKIIPLAFDGSNAWGSPPLAFVKSIDDYKMILVITDDPNTAKIWIEQIGTQLEETPLTMVVGAQVEPLIQPYFRSSPQLLKGYVAGVIDSMYYESLSNEPNLASTTWLPFNVGIFITVGTIFISGMANGFMSLLSRHRSRQSGVQK